MSIKSKHIGHQIADACKYNSKDIVKSFLDALTDANYHFERRQLVPIINKTFKTKIHLDG